MVEAEGKTIDYFHAASTQYVENIFKEGFKKPEHINEDGYEQNKSYYGCLGWGTYISQSMETALLFDPVLVRVHVKKGTRLLNITRKPDEKVIKTLKRKYGRDLLSADASIWKILPRNKQLTLEEIVALTRYQNWHSWGDPSLRKLAVDNYGYTHYKSLYRCMSMLRRYKYDGLGDEEDSLGIVIFSPERVLPKEVIFIGEGPLAKYRDDWESYSFQSAEEIRKIFWKHGTAEQKALAEKCNSYVAG